MKQPNFFYLIAAYGCMLIIGASCNNSESKKNEIIVPKDTVVAEKPVVETKRGPVINIDDTVSVKRIVLTMKDSALTPERVSLKLAEIYDVKLATIISSNKLKVTGMPMAWFKSQKPPYFFEAGLPVNKKPAKSIPEVFIKETGIDSVLVAHFYGPYELLPQAYDVLDTLLKERKKKLKSSPYAIYVDPPNDSIGRPKNPYKVQTDVVYPWK
ncbi:hypothetical protein BH11BAC3_BH11BAC3_32420 [soil metagenome]